MPGIGRITDIASCDGVHCHGCPVGSHFVTGPAITGSSTVLVNNLPALRVTDMGIAAACCGTNLWQAKSGSSTVFINSLPAHRQTDKVSHCGLFPGTLMTGSPNVIVGG